MLLLISGTGPTSPAATYTGKVLRVPTITSSLPIVDADGNPTAHFVQAWNNSLKEIVTSLNSVLAAQAAAAQANSAAVAANTAATTANAAAATAQTTATAITSSQSLGSSYVSGATISATDAGGDVTVTISAHTRIYPNANGTTTSVAVNSGTLTGLNYSTKYYVFYDDAARSGGAVTYQSSTSVTVAAQIGARHVVGGVTTPAAAGTAVSGRYVRPPGSGYIDFGTL